MNKIVDSGERDIVVKRNGFTEWQRNGILHCEDGPARISPNGTKWWLQNGLRHRIDGPAVVYFSGEQKWYLNGLDITKEIEGWMARLEITWPWNEDTQTEFLLTWA